MTKVSSQTVSFTDTLREEQQERFPLLSEVTKGYVADPLALMNMALDEDMEALPCALPDTMWQSLPKMIRDVLALYEDPDIRTMLLMGAMATIGSALSNVRVRHERRLYSMGMMCLCVGPSASGKGAMGDVASLVSDIDATINEEWQREMTDYKKKSNRFERYTKQREREAQRDTSQLVDINDIADEAEEPQPPLRRMHMLPTKTTAANYHVVLYANGRNISYLYVPELAELNAGNKGAFGDFKYMMLAAQNEEPLHTGRKTDDEDYRIEHTRLAIVATGTFSAVQAFIPNLEDGLSTRFIYHNLPGKRTMRDEMDEATAMRHNATLNSVREAVTAIWTEQRLLDDTTDEELPRLIISNEQREMVNKYYQQLAEFAALAMHEVDLRAAILRSRLNLYRMLMILAVMRRYEERGSAKGMFDNREFTIADEDLHWALSYVFYTIGQTSTMYSRLRTEEKKARKRTQSISALGFLMELPDQFTTKKACEIAEAIPMAQRTVSKHLKTLKDMGLIVCLKKGTYVKVEKRGKKMKHAA